MSLAVKNGQASVVLRFKLLDSSSTVGAGLTGLTSASSGLRISTIADNEASATAYTVAGSTIEAVTTLGTYAAPTATKCRFKEVDATNHPGLYEFQFADARLAVSSAKSLVISISGATNLVQADYSIPLVVDDPYTAKITSGTGSGQLSVSSGTVDLGKILGTAVSTPATAGILDVNVKNIDNDAASASGTVTFPNATLASTTNITAGTITTATNLTNAPTSGDFTAAMKTSLNAATPAVTVSDKTGFSLASGGLAAVTAWSVAITGNITGSLSGSVGSVTAGVTVATNNDKTGYSLTQAFPSNFSALGIGAGGHILTVDTLTTYTGNAPQTGDAYARVGAAGAGLTALGDTRIAHLDADISSRSTFAGGAVASVTGAVGSVTGITASDVGAIKAKTDNLPSDPADQSLIIAATDAVRTDISALPTAATVGAIKTKTDNLPASPAAVGSAMTLTGAYDAAKTAAAQTSVDDLPTNAELATALAGADDATLAAIAALPTTSTIMSADVKKVNGVTVNGDGAGTPWGP